MNYYFNVAVANGINKLGWTPDVPDEHLGYKFSPTCHEVITICEEIEKLVEGWPVVTRQDLPIMDCWKWGESNTQNRKETHKARLAFIEEIKKECVNHTPSWNGLKTTMSVDRFDNRFANVESTCIDCGVKLQATWSEKK